MLAVVKREGASGWLECCSLMPLTVRLKGLPQMCRFVPMNISRHPQ
jgi:hypothetical protein